MIGPIKVQMTPLTERREILCSTVGFVVFVARPAVGVGNTEVGDRKHNRSTGSSRHPGRGTTPLADPLSAITPDR